MTSSTLVIIIFLAICAALWGLFELALYLFKRWINRLVNDSVENAVTEKLAEITSGN